MHGIVTNFNAIRLRILQFISATISVDPLDRCFFAVQVNYASTPRPDSVTSLSMSISWPQTEQVTAGLEQHYRYVVEIAESGQDAEPRTMIVQMGENTTDVTGLKYNTLYNVRVRIDAEHDTQTLEGQPGDDIGVKTKCRGRFLRINIFFFFSSGFSHRLGPRNGYEFLPFTFSCPVRPPPLTPHFPCLFTRVFPPGFCLPLRLFPVTQLHLTLLLARDHRPFS